MFTAVEAPGVIAPPSVGLIPSAIRPADQGAGRWVHGFTWRPNRQIVTAGFDICGDLDERPDPVDTSLVHVRPVGYYVEDECSTLGGGPDDELVQRQAEAVASYRVARELWRGDLTKAQPYDASGSTGLVNPHLANPDAETVGTGVPAALAVALVEQAARVAMGGQEPYVHVPITVLPFLTVRRVGNLLYTPSDARIVCDAGYDGSGPAGQAASATSAWVYATGPVAVRLSEVIVQDAVSSLDRATNRQLARGQRVFASQFDPGVHFAASVALPTVPAAAPATP